MKDESVVLVKGILLGMLNPLRIKMNALGASHGFNETPELLLTPKQKDEWDKALQQEKDFLNLLEKSKINIISERKFVVGGEWYYVEHERGCPRSLASFDKPVDFYARCWININKFFAANNLNFSIDDLFPVVTNKVNEEITKRASGIKGLFGKKVTYTALVEQKERVYSETFKECIDMLNQLLEPIGYKFDERKCGFGDLISAWRSNENKGFKPINECVDEFYGSFDSDLQIYFWETNHTDLLDYELKMRKLNEDMKKIYDIVSHYFE